MIATSAAAAFVIMITNPVGVPASLGYPNVVFQQYSPVIYPTLQQCMNDLALARQNDALRLRHTVASAEFHMVMKQRIDSMQCLPAGTRPAPRMKVLVTTSPYLWRIGRLGPDNFFLGQNVDIRQFGTQAQCAQALQALLVKFPSAEVAQAYRCLNVIPVSQYAKTKLLLPPMVPNGAYLVTPR